MSILSNIVKVDAKGITADGDDTTLIAADEPVRMGWMVNVPVLAEYPDGKLQQGNMIRVTPKGMERLKRDVPLDHRETGGSA